MLKSKRHLGQNFLIDQNIAGKIVDSLEAGSDDRVIEIGPGTGALTRLLASRYPDFAAVEIDERAVDILREKYPTVEIIHDDVLNIDWHAISSERDTFVIGNLPYYITSPILFGLIDSSADIRQAVIMVQLEVARRMTAVPRTKDYGILSVTSQLAGEVELLFKVSRNVFRPVPEVESAVVRITFRRSPERNDPFLRRVIRTAFNQRRKTLRNSLKSISGETGITLDEPYVKKRPEELAPPEFIDLANFFKAG